MHAPLNQNLIKQLFTEARSHHSWTDRPVSEETLVKLYETAKWGPTALNTNPARFVFVRSAEQKEKLVPSLMGSNIDQIRAAPVTVIVAYDERFYDQVKRLFPAYDATEYFASNKPGADEAAFRNSTLQGAYMLLAARSLGLDVCPMSGFDNKALDATFFEGTNWKSNFIFTLGYGDHSKLFPRGPRLEFEEACKIV